MTKQTITVIPGDGIGPSIIDATIKVLDKQAVILSMNLLMLV
jgi:isocitrate/isopropylmalate dehydrogenase